MPQDSIWSRFKGGSKKNFDALYRQLDRLGPPVNRLSNRLGAEAFWPTSLDKESEKAARILKSFCRDGFYTEEETETPEGTKVKHKVIQKIPSEVIANAKGLAIFTTMRTGLWISGAGGSGVLTARLPDGTWSPPSGIMLHTSAIGFLMGIDIYDCVVVINTEKALEAFSKLRCTLGGEISITAGPVGIGGALDSELHRRRAPIFTYMKARGFYAGVQIDGTIILERNDENEKFYGEAVSVNQILTGALRHPPAHAYRQLAETLKAAQGDDTYDEAALPSGPPPSDYTVDDERMFGVPVKDDPDPYGVLALEKEGMSVKEAGTQKRASWQEFNFNPSPTSPVHSMFNRTSIDKARHSGSRRNSWRTSTLSGEIKPSSSRTSLELRGSAMTDSSTQTAITEDRPMSPLGPLSIRSGHSSRGSINPPQILHLENLPEEEALDSSQAGNEQPQGSQTVNGYNTPPGTPPLPILKVDHVQDGEHKISSDVISADHEADLTNNEPRVEETNRTAPTDPIDPVNRTDTTSAEIVTKEAVGAPIAIDTSTEGLETPAKKVVESKADEHNADKKDDEHEEEKQEQDDDDDDDDDDEFLDADEEEVEIIEPHVFHTVQAAASPIIPGAASRAKVVNVGKRPPPPSLPPRNPRRPGRASPSSESTPGLTPQPSSEKLGDARPAPAHQNGDSFEIPSNPWMEAEESHTSSPLQVAVSSAK